MKKKNKIKTITEIIDEMQMRREWNFGVRELLGYTNEQIHGTTNITVHNG